MFKPRNLPAKVMMGLLLTGIAVFFFLSRPTEPELSAPKSNPHPPEALAAAQAVLSTPGPEINRMLESLPSAGSAAFPASSPGRKGLLGLNVGQIYQQALNAKNPEDRSLAFFVAADCSSVASTRLSTVKEIFKGTEGQHFAEHPMAALYDGLMASSRKELEAFCSTGDVGSFFRGMKSVKQSTGQATGPVWAGVVLGSDKANSPKRQEYFQSMTQVLSAPNQYPAHFDRWTGEASFAKLTRFLGAGYGEADLIADSLFKRFGMEDMVEYRQMKRCALKFMCFRMDMLSEAKRRQIEMVADQIEQLIRTQRWDVLLAPRD